MCCTFIHVCRQLQTQISSVSPLQACGYSCTLIRVSVHGWGHEVLSVQEREMFLCCFLWLTSSVEQLVSFSSCLYLISVSDQLSVTSSCCSLPSHITNAHTQWTAISDASPFPPPLFPPVALLQSHLLCIRPILFVTGRL